MKTALITGGARRIGATITQYLHYVGFQVIIHYRQSHAEAQALCARLNDIRPHSAYAVYADLNCMDDVKKLAEKSLQHVATINPSGISLLVNNASAFYPRTFDKVNESDWDALFNSNVKAPYFLSQHLLASLSKNHGTIINIVDANLDRLLNQHSTYQMAKSALLTMTKTLAKELAPDVRVNGISPGSILWPEVHEKNQIQHEHDAEKKHAHLQSIPMQRLGCAQDIAEAVLFLANATYITGHILTIDGGKTL